MGMVIDENDHFYLFKDGADLRASIKQKAPHQVGECVKGFAYADMKQKLRLTTLASHCNSKKALAGDGHRSAQGSGSLCGYGASR